MVIQLPFVWASLLFVTGISLGHFFPSRIYLFLLLALLVSVFMTRGKARDYLILGAWLLLGCVRVNCSFSTEGDHSDGLSSAIMAKAKETNLILKQRLYKSEMESEPAAIASALLLGDKSALTKSTKKKFASVGASHLLALSGMHLGILYGVLHLLFVRIIKTKPWKWHCLPLILLCIWGYVWMAGMPVSLVRAGVMYSFVSVAVLWNTNTPSLHTLSMSALLILMAAPAELFSVSFQLSFAATFFILFFYDATQPMIMWAGHGFRPILRLLAVSLTAQMGTAPLVAYYFHNFPLIGLPAGMLLVPLTSVIIYGCVVLLFFPSRLLGVAVGSMLDLETWIMEKCGELPFASIQDLYPKPWQLIIIYTLLVAFGLRKKQSNQNWN